jgi:4-hydroxybenzoate polyprenyltransferase
MSSASIFAYLQLTRPANVVTAIADIFAGFAVAGAWTSISSDVFSWNNVYLLNLGWLSLSTIGLYAGGVAFNDVFDAKLDSVERPERPIPSGKVSKSSAIWMSLILLLIGVLAAVQVSLISGVIALTVAVLAVLYDYWGKHQKTLGPINMGLCRTGNLLLGVSVVPIMLSTQWQIGLLPLVFVAAITMISRGEVHGKNKKALYGGLGMYVIVILAICSIPIINGNGFFEVIPFLLLLCYMIFPPLIKAIRTQEPKLIAKSVKAAVISLIIVNSSIAAAFAGWMIGLIVLALLPISLWLARKFAVT